MSSLCSLLSDSFFQAPAPHSHYTQPPPHGASSRSRCGSPTPGASNHRLFTRGAETSHGRVRLVLAQELVSLDLLLRLLPHFTWRGKCPATFGGEVQASWWRSRGGERSRVAWFGQAELVGGGRMQGRVAGVVTEELWKGCCSRSSHSKTGCSWITTGAAGCALPNTIQHLYIYIYICV